ncbi:unnamed protein product [Schistosoma curassoni]|uniref:Uncharacterized protein n=1 Tax=Schistosoma curassoni TaxID=6186 RepID=A0A183KZA0_9TREM|nr:unnamed protein product [Schistosoma curassoni]
MFLVSFFLIYDRFAICLNRILNIGQSVKFYRIKIFYFCKKMIF